MTFDYATAISSGADSSFVTEYARGVLLGGGSVSNAPATASLTLSAADLANLEAARACSGSNGHGVYWWGTQIRLDSCNTNLLVATMNGGAGVATLAALITSWTGVGGAAAAVAAAVFVIGAGAVAACNMYGNGIYLNQLWTGTPFCWGQ